MNNSKTPTSQKIGVPLRIEPELYNKMVEKVQTIKKKQRAYSINQMLTEMLEEKLKEE